MEKYVVTGGLGFIGSNYIRFLLKNFSDIKIVNLDKMTYAGNPENLKDFENDDRYSFVKGDICDRALVEDLFRNFKPDYIINFAAESHVDRSIQEAADFIRTDVEGVWNLLENAKKFGFKRFIQISTDEVYGSIKEGFADENYPLKPSNPYSASKAGGDRLAYSYYVTFGLPVIITRASNNYGPYQYPEKLIPLFITNAIEGKKLPVYGDGMQKRDWLYVEDHCEAIQFILKNGKDGETYNISGGNEKYNIDVTKKLLELLGKGEELISYVADRPGHDRRYALNSEKLKALGWEPKIGFDEGLKRTVDWYVNNENWWRKLKDESFKRYYERNYNWRFK